jgi:hypothetical protein
MNEEKSRKKNHMETARQALNETNTPNEELKACQAA